MVEAMKTHPDIAELREKYEVAAETPTAQVVDGLTLLAGLYLAMSPWIVGFTDLSTLTVNNLISGVAVSLLALGMASAYGRTHGIAWVTPVIGAWTIIAPWAVSGDVSTTATIVSNVVIGAVIVILGLGTMAPGLSRGR